LKDRDRLENRSDRNIMQVKKENYEVLHLGRKKSMHQYMLGATQLKSSFAENDLGVLVDTKLNTPLP